MNAIRYATRAIRLSVAIRLRVVMITPPRSDMPLEPLNLAILPGHGYTNALLDTARLFREEWPLRASPGDVPT